jgi:hypothetical protein
MKYRDHIWIWLFKFIGEGFLVFIIFGSVVNIYLKSIHSKLRSI